MNSQQFTVSAAEAGQRLDVYCVSKIPGVSRAAIQKSIKAGDIKIDGQAVKPRQPVKPGNVISAPALNASPASSLAPPPPISLPIIYENNDVVVINKPAGLVVHPGVNPISHNQIVEQGNEPPTVASWFAERYPQAAQVGEGPGRPGIVHRLDKDTSGVMVLAKTQPAYQHLKHQWQKRQVRKKYVALVFGVPKYKHGRINQPLARSKKNPLRRTIDSTGKPAITAWQIEQVYNGQYSLLNLKPRTGRMHQLRVHLHHLGHPVVGDKLYTFKRQKPPHGVQRQLLHAQELTFFLPSGKRTSHIAPLPEDFDSVLTQIDKNDV